MILNVLPEPGVPTTHVPRKGLLLSLIHICLYHGHQPLVLRHFLLAEVLLQDNQVTAHLRARVVREQVVGQAYRCV